MVSLESHQAPTLLQPMAQGQQMRSHQTNHIWKTFLPLSLRCNEKDHWFLASCNVGSERLLTVQLLSFAARQQQKCISLPAWKFPTLESVLEVSGTLWRAPEDVASNLAKSVKQYQSVPSNFYTHNQSTCEHYGALWSVRWQTRSAMS